MRFYPIFVDLAGQACVVLGGGSLAVQKVEGLVEAGAKVTVYGSRPAAALGQLATGGSIKLIRRDYLPGDLAEARLVIDASEDDAINRASWEEAEAAGILINVVDRPLRCRFIAPAIVRRDPVIVAVSTSGESPFLASVLRARIERWLGREWGPFAELVGRVRRRLREGGVPLIQQTTVYRRLLHSRVRELLRAGEERAANEVALAIEQSHGSRSAGGVALVGAGPGDPDLLTFRARELLADADYVLHDALIAPRALALCGEAARLENVGKRAGLNNPRQEHINARMIELARAGHAVVRLKGGDPFVFGRGGEELAALLEAGIDVVVVPGVSAAIAAAAAAGIPLTMRGVSSSLAITAARGGDGEERLRELARSAETLVVLMPRTNLSDVAATLIAAVGGSRPAAIISNATLPDQRSVSARLDNIARAADEAGISTPATLVVGDVVTAIPAISTLDARIAAASSAGGRH
jgi:uroporphyrin-III C-methyltransferase/precorrin-2 dehydrogenase/sirohydrochlorin ferrochelatase